MGYQEAMEAAGAKVLDFQAFGGYQGEWLALVTYNGKTYWVRGNYGSCSGCDAFQAEFDYYDKGCSDHRWDKQANCTACNEAAVEYQRKLAEFGRSYLVGDDWTTEELITKLEKDIIERDWDSEVKEQLEYVKKFS